MFILVTSILDETKMLLKNHQMDSVRNEITSFRGDIIHSEVAASYYY